jgi:hypothetical protein
VTVVRVHGARLGTVIVGLLAMEIGQGFHREVFRGRAHMSGKAVQATLHWNGPVMGRWKLSNTPRHSGEGRWCGG